jgi:hypothetical protein
VAITFIAAADAPVWPGGTVNNTSSVTVSKPTGTASGDFMIAFAQSGGSIVHSAPAGWTKHSVLTDTLGTNLTNTLFYKVAGGSEPSTYNFTDDSGDGTPLTVVVATFRGVDPDNPINVSTTAESSGTTAKATPSATTTERCHMLHYRIGKSSTVGTASRIRSRSERRVRTEAEVPNTSTRSPPRRTRS